MKKSKLSLGLVTGFVASLALAGCGDVTKKDSALLTYKGYDGNTYDIVTEKMYAEYRKDSKVISTFYDKVLEVLIRDLFNSGYSGTKSYATIEALAKEDVKAAKAKATENAKTNNTSYDKEWDSILSGEGVEDEKELLQKYIYNQEKEVLEDDIYASLNKNDKLKESWIETTLPYHIRHILAKVDSGASEYTRGTISADQAKKISDAGLALGLHNETFGGVAKLFSEDSSSSTYGDVGLVTNKASSTGSFSMVTEFQLAIYIYDAIYKGRADAEVNKLFDNEDGTKDTLVANAKAAFANITAVPYDVFRQLASKANGGLGDVTDYEGIQVGEGEEAVYPRNILWNKYLNHHEPFLITNDSIDDTEITNTTDWDAIALQPNSVGAAVDPDIVAVDNGLTDPAFKKVTGFRPANKVGLDALGDKLVLTDEKANPIFGVRSEYGIHFIIIEKSAFESTETLKTYYQAYSPKQAEWDSSITTPTYVNYAGFTDAQMLERANAVKDAIKGFDGTYQYKIFDYLMDATNYGGSYKAIDRFDLSNPEAAQLLDEIKAYVTRQAEKSDYDQEEGFNLAWSTFIDKFNQQTAERKKVRRLIPYGCAIGFKDGAHKDLYEIGGPCYYGNKTK